MSGFLSDLGSAFTGGIFDFIGNENLQDQAQGFNAHQAAIHRDWSSAQAMAQRDWQTQMSNTAVRRHARDLKQAGFNPLLSIAPGAGASTPSGAIGSSSPASSPAASTHPNFAAAMASASQVNVNEAQAELLRAEAKEVIARTPRHEWDIKEIQARIPVHEEQVRNLNQQINHSVADVNRIYQDIAHSQSSAKHLDQQVVNLKATLPLIREQIQNLKALTAKNSAETDEIKQRIKENLPELERSLGNLEVLSRRMAQPAQANAERAADSFIGQLGAYVDKIRHLLPHAGVILNPRGLGGGNDKAYKPDWDGRKR